MGKIFPAIIVKGLEHKKTMSMKENKMSANVVSGEQKQMVKYVVNGVIAGLVGGVVFGMMMAMMGMLPMVAMLVGSQSPIVGVLVHMVISAAIGFAYGLVLFLTNFEFSIGFAIVSGMVNGIVWWVLGALILMPLGLGMNEMVFKIGTDQWFSLMGHVIYGVVAGLVFRSLIKK